MTASRLCEMCARCSMCARVSPAPSIARFVSETTAATLAYTATWPDWVQPTGAHDAYPAGRIVQHNGVLYRSLIAANVWEPGGKGVSAGLWKTVTDAGDPPTTTDAQKWAAGTAYRSFWSRVSRPLGRE